MQTAVVLAPRSANAHGRLGFAFFTEERYARSDERRNYRFSTAVGDVLEYIHAGHDYYLGSSFSGFRCNFFAFIFFGSRFKPQPGEDVLSSYFLVFYKERPGRFILTSRRLVYVPEAVSQWFGATRLSIEREQVEKITCTSSVSGGSLSIATKDGAMHKFSMPNLVLDPLSRKLDGLNLGAQSDLVSA